MSAQTRLEHLLSPISLSDFLDRYNDQKYLYIDREDPDHYGDLFGLGDVDQVLEIIRHHPDNLLTLVPPPDSGRPKGRHPVSHFTTKQLYECFQQGDTLVINHLQQFWPVANRLAMDLSAKLCCTVNINLYMTPADAQGFTVHIDKHDVFIAQVDGAKDWYLYECDEDRPICDLPICDSKLKQNVAMQAPSDEMVEEELTLAEKHTVSKGDFLYVPRGVPHKAVATPGWPSLHLTIGLHPVTWMETLKVATELVSLEDVDFRRSISPAFFYDPEAKEAMVERFRGLLDRLVEKADFDEVRRVLARDRFDRTALPPDGHFGQLLQLGELTPESVLERRVGLVPTVEVEEQVARIRFANNTVQGPPAIEAMLRHVRAHERFRVSDLPGPLSDKSKLVLVRRLVKEGLLRRVADSDSRVTPQEATGS